MSETAAPEAPKLTRGESLLATREAKFKELFEGKKFDVKGEIHLEGEQRFQTPFGNKGRHGFVLVEVGNPTNKFIVGETTLREAAEKFGAVEVPVKERKRRTKEQKAADDAADAAAKAEAEVEAAKA